MGGKTGQTKQRIIEALYAAEQAGRRVTATDLAIACHLSLSTISGHVFDLREKSKFVLDCGDIRGWIELTPSGRAHAQALQPRSEGIPFRGIIAAGPATRIEQVDDMLAIREFDPAHHFALRVRGTSMISFGILDGDIVILRTVASWQDVPDGKIVAARVPEGTGSDDENWLDSLGGMADSASVPALDHVTLKQFNARFRSYLRDGLPERQAAPMLRGSNGMFRPLAIAIDGVMVQLLRDYE